MVLIGEGTKAFLVGGDYVVYAKREPLNQLELYSAHRWHNRDLYSAARDDGPLEIVPHAVQSQARRVRSVFDRALGSVDYEMVSHRNESRYRPTVEDFPELQESL